MVDIQPNTSNTANPAPSKGSEMSESEKAAAQARALNQKAMDERAKAIDAAKPDAERNADKMAKEADDARAKAAQLSHEESRRGVREDTVATAGIVAPHADPELSAADFMAVKKGNDPANPQPAPGLVGNPDVRLSRRSPDFPDQPLEIMVHEKMVGDYLRAGWSKD